MASLKRPHGSSGVDYKIFRFQLGNQDHSKQDRHFRSLLLQKLVAKQLRHGTEPAGGLLKPRTISYILAPNENAT